MLGPAEAPIAVVRGRHRWRLLVKAPRDLDIQGYLRTWLATLPKPPADLRLSVDLDLQQAMVTAFGDMDGSAVALDPRTGEILGMVSLPGYDTNLFVNGISRVDYKALMDNPSRPLFNRNVLGGGPPGSTVKPLIGLAGLDSGLRRLQRPGIVAN